VGGGTRVQGIGSSASSIVAPNPILAPSVRACQIWSAATIIWIAAQRQRSRRPCLSNRTVISTIDEDEQFRAAITHLMRAMDFMVKAFPSAAIRRRPKLRSVAHSLPQEKNVLVAHPLLVGVAGRPNDTGLIPSIKRNSLERL
jgi:hypothetical protein